MTHIDTHGGRGASQKALKFNTLYLNGPLDLRVIILCSETPFVGDEPSMAKEKVVVHL